MKGFLCVIFLPTPLPLCDGTLRGPYRKDSSLSSILRMKMQQNEKILHLVHEIATAGAANKRDDIMMGAYLAAITVVTKGREE